MKQSKKQFFTTAVLLAAFVLWTALIQRVDVQAIGPEGSAVGFATVNGFLHRLTGVHLWLYTLTDWLGLVPLCFVAGFGMLGLVQWIKRKHILKVDADILILGGFYVIVMTVFLLFELLIVNDRPVLIDGRLEASYPSSTTMLVLCVMPTAIVQLKMRIKIRPVRICIVCVLGGFTAFMVVGRFISGVHWFTDIIGGGLLSAGLVAAYIFAHNMAKDRLSNRFQPVSD